MYNTFVLFSYVRSRNPFGKRKRDEFLPKEQNTDCERYYVVCSDVFSDESLARISADEARTSGGAGYIIYDENTISRLRVTKAATTRKKSEKEWRGAVPASMKSVSRRPRFPGATTGKRRRKKRIEILGYGVFPPLRNHDFV